MWLFFFYLRPWLRRFISNNDMYGVMLQLCGDGSTWLLMLVIVCAAVVPDIFIRSVRDTFSIAYRDMRKPKVRTKRLLQLLNLKLTAFSKTILYEPNESHVVDNIGIII